MPTFRALAAAGILSPEDASLPKAPPPCCSLPRRLCLYRQMKNVKRAHQPRRGLSPPATNASLDARRGHSSRLSPGRSVPLHLLPFAQTLSHRGFFFYERLTQIHTVRQHFMSSCRTPLSRLLLFRFRKFGILRHSFNRQRSVGLLAVTHNIS